ncbi:Lysine-specific demethylase lid, partial [Gryllus bimaculatus]
MQRNNGTLHMAHQTSELLQRFKWEVWQRPPYSPDLALCDYHGFGALKKDLDGRRLQNSEVEKAALSNTPFLASKAMQILRIQNTGVMETKSNLQDSAMKLKRVSSTDRVNVIHPVEEYFSAFERTKVKVDDFVLVSFSNYKDKKMFYAGKFKEDKEEEGDMVISRSDAKKRRKEGDTLEDSLQGSPKRTKVHAQRKFAQGSSNVSSPALTPVKDKDKVKTNGAVLSPELISSKRPKTEDFLTFLCFRGTPILPPQLDFFNVATIQDNQDEEHCSSGGDYSASRPTSLVSTAQKPQKSMGTEQTPVPGTVKKNDKVENETKKRPSTSVQALRKKYQEQRLAKQKASTLSKLAQKVKGKNMVRTRSSVLREESRTTDIRSFPSKRHLVKKPVGPEHSVSKNLKPLKYMSLRRLSVRGQPKLLRELESPAMRRGGLRSSGQLPPGSDEGLKTEKPLNHRLQPKDRYDKAKPKMFVSSLSDFSSDDDQPLVKKTRPLEQMKPSSKQQLARKMVKRIVKSSRKMHPHMITRSRQQCQDDVGHYHSLHMHQHIQKQSQQRQQLQQSVQQQHQQQQQQLQHPHHHLHPHLLQQQQLRQQQQLQPTRSQQSQQIVSRFSNRPTRKTKEAAALYMELLGKKLISRDGDGDEDSFSVDSFPELPSSKRNEQRELEIKTKCSKEVQHHHSQECQVLQHQVQKKENSLSKREIHIKKEIHFKKEQNNPRKHDVKISPKLNEIRTVVKRSLRIAKEDSSEIKMDRIRKKSGKSKVSNLVTQKTKSKLEINPKVRARDHLSFFTFDTKLKTSVVGHSLRSRKTTRVSLQVEENEMEVGTKSTCPRRSLRRGSRDAVQCPENSSPGITSDNDLVKSQKSNSTSGHLLKKSLVKASKINLDSLEDKFSDSDEEPLKKIALKNNVSKKIDVAEEKQGEATNNRKLLARESKNMPQMCNNLKEKCKLITKVTRASACFTDETSIKVKGGGSVSIKKVLKKKSVRYSKVTVSTDRKNKQVLEREKLSVGKVKETSRKQRTDLNFRMNSSENCLKSSGKLGKKELSENKTNKNNSGSPKITCSDIITQKEKIIRKKKKEKNDGKTSVSVELSKIALEGKKKLEDIIDSKTDPELCPPDNLIPPVVKSPENTSSSDANSPSKICSHSVELISGEKDETKNIKQNVQNSEKISYDVLIKSSHLKKGKIESSEKKSDLGAHVHPMRKCLVGIESEFRKISHTNCLQRKGTGLSKKEFRADVPRRSSTSCPKETELELQRRLSMVCLKESEPDIETEKKSEKEEIIGGIRMKPEGDKQAIETPFSKLNTIHNSNQFVDSKGVTLCAPENVLKSTNVQEHSAKNNKIATNINVVEKLVDGGPLSYVKCVSAVKKDVTKNIASTNVKPDLQNTVENNVVAPFTCKNGNNSRYELSFANLGSCVNSGVKLCAEPDKKNTFEKNNIVNAGITTEETTCKEHDLPCDLISVNPESNFCSTKGIILSDPGSKGKLGLMENHQLDDVSPSRNSLINTSNQVNDYSDALSTANVSDGVTLKHCVVSGLLCPELFEKKDKNQKQSPHVLCRRSSEVKIQEQSEILEKTEPYNPKAKTLIDLECIENNTPLKLGASDVDLEKGNLGLNSLLPPDLGLRDMKVKEKLNMSAERVEKWLSESCTGNLEHKKECTLYDKNVCNCGFSIIDDDLCLSDYGNDKITMDCISGDCEEEGAVKMAATVCPFTSEFAVMQTANSENLKPSNMEEPSASVISPDDKVCKEKEISLSTLTESSSIEKVAEAPPNYEVLPKPVSVSFDVLDKKKEWETSKKCTEAPAEQGARVGCTESHPPPLINSNISTSSKNNPQKETITKNNQILNVMQNQVPIVLENTNSKSECVQEKGKLSSVLSDKNTKKSKETNKSEVSSMVRTGTKLLQGSERVSEKKSIFQQRRSFPHKVKERKDLTPSANAFSPENESSVYAFETEPDSPPISTPFRRRARDSRTSSTTTSKSEEDLVKLTDEDVCMNSSNVSSSLLVPSPEKVISSSAVNNSCSSEVQTPNAMQDSSHAVCSRNSTSIAVQVNLDSEACSETSPPNVPPVEAIIPEPVPQRSMECSTQTEVAEEEDDESEGHLFYIPLQQAPTPAQQVIQGVAVKLGTEGPTGPNQRVIMRAKLVTKPPSFSRPATSAPDGALGIRRSVLGTQPSRSTGILTIDQKTAFIGPSNVSSVSGTYPPVVPVQPTSRSQPSTIVSESKSDATTATPENRDAKRTSLSDSSSQHYESKSTKKKETNIEAFEKSTLENVQTKVDMHEKEKKITDAILTTSCALATSSKTTSKGNTRNSNDHMLPSSLKGNYGNAKRNLLKGKMSKTSDPSYTCFPSNVAKFPSVGSPAQLVEAPVFYPSEKEFQDPLEYIDRIRPVAETFGLCRVVPPQNFRPECKVSDDMRFTAYNQYVHKMLYRWGPNVKEMMAIKKYLVTQSVSFTHPPLIGGMEVDLPRLYQTVQSFGGLKEVIEKKRWQRVADGMKIPKSAQDRVTKLDDIYCKYLLPYDTLSPGEREKLLDEVEQEWKQRQSRPLSQESCSTSDSPEDESDADIADEECIVKGRNMPLNAFYRIARNTMAMWFRQPEPSASEVEQEFWKHVMSRNSHVCVHSGSIDSSGCGYGFPCSKNSPFARHPWNLKVLTNNSGSVLRSIGPIMGVTVPTLHVGMLFTTCCWYRDPHGLPWIEYGVPDSYSFVFQSAMSKLIPRYCKKKTIWLPSDTAMVPPSLLVKHGVSLCHTVQEPGQFIIVFPRAFTSSICTGYLVSESVYFAQPHWLSRAEEVFKDIQDSCEPSMFSLERLLFSIASDARSHIDVLKQ